MAIDPKTFLYELDETSSVATLTLNRPHKLNALTFEVYAELRDVFRQVNSEPGVRAVVITGAGRAFCSGGDVEDIIGKLLGRDYEQLLEFTRLTCDMILAMRQCKRPIVAALNGTVAGAGAVIAAAADIRIAAESAKIGFMFTKVGLAGADMGATWLLPRLVGLSQATRMLMTGDFTDAQEAYRIGLYHAVVPQEEVMETAMAFAKKLAKGPSLGLEITKDLLNRGANMDLVSELEAEAQIQAACMQHPNFAESHKAFVEKRKPEFT